MGFTEITLATEKECNAPWAGNKKNFRCALCGHRFKVGDPWRMVFTNDIPGAGGNPLVCGQCNDDDIEAVRQKWVERCREWRENQTGNKFWWFSGRSRR